MTLSGMGEELLLVTIWESICRMYEVADIMELLGNVPMKISPILNACLYPAGASRVVSHPPRTDKIG